MGLNLDDVSGPTIRPSKLAHVVLRTANKNALAKFYVDFLGGFLVHENDELAFITYDDEHHRIAILGIPGLKPKDKGTSGLEHMAFTFDTLEDLFRAFKQRQKKGIVPFWCVNHGITVSLYYADPDGNVLETQYDTFTESKKATEYMTSPAFKKNPIGADFDPEEFIKRMENGESLDSLTKMPDVGPRGLGSLPV